MNSPTQKLYISHAPEDLELALEISKYLEKDGFATSVNRSMTDQRIESKSNIYDSISEIRALIVLLTPNSLVDEHVKRETNIAIENKIPLYPVNLSGEHELKKLLSSEWRYWLSITQILTCNDAREASRKLRFRIPADAASKLGVDLPARQLIVGSWRAFESLFDQIENSKITHSFIDFQDLHTQFDNDIASGLIESSKGSRSSGSEFRIENRFIGKMLFGLYGYLQYFDCHALTINRENSCGLKGHEIETLIDRYVNFAATLFEYPSGITCYTETQFLWKYQNFLDLCKPLLKSENFSDYAQVLTLDYEPFYKGLFKDELDLQESDFKAKSALNAHVFNDLSKCMFYDNVSVIANGRAPLTELNLALSSIDTFLQQSGFDPGEFESLAPIREEFQMSGYPALLLFRAYLLQLLGKEEEVALALQDISLSDLMLIKDFLSQSLSASNGVGQIILEQLWVFYQENNEIDFPNTEHLEEYIGNHEERYFTVAEQLYILASRFGESGDLDTAMNLWAGAARGGVFSGLASYTWATLQIGEFDTGVALHEECIEIPCEPIYELERFNCKGNYILNLLARDVDYATAIKNFNSLILEEGSDTTFGSYVSLLTLEFQFGDRGRAIQVFRSIPSEVLIELKQAYEQEAARVEGWLLGWCSQVLVVLREISKG